jgi:DNA gyrase/topoisomerase IV subunit B
MYFGCGGSSAIVKMVMYAVSSVLDNGADAWRGKLAVSVTNGATQSITVSFHGLLYDRFLPGKNVNWFEALTERGLWNWWLGIIAGACGEFVSESSDGTVCRRLEMRDCLEVSDIVRNGDGETYFRITFSPVAAYFQTIRVDEYYQIIGWLRDLSMLRCGMKTRFTADDLEGEFCGYYKEGMKSFLFEADYGRYAQHPGCLHFAAEAEAMKVECYLRFLHAGTPAVKSFVNYHPTSGGSHLEGLGKALRVVFPDSTRGCRQSRFITNPDTNKGVVIPRPFIGVMHVQLTEPRFYGPTRDVLMMNEVAKFVYEAAVETLKKQWETFNPPIDRQKVYEMMMRMKALEAEHRKEDGDATPSG